MADTAVSASVSASLVKNSTHYIKANKAIKNGKSNNNFSSNDFILIQENQINSKKTDQDLSLTVQ